MARAVKLAATLFCGASALLTQQEQQRRAEAQSLLELFGQAEEKAEALLLAEQFPEDGQAPRAMPMGLSYPHAHLAKFGIYPLTEGRVNATKFLVQDVFKKHGHVISRLLEWDEGSFGGCSSGDFSVLRKAVGGRGSLVDYDFDHCAPDVVNSVEGFDHGMLALCLLEANKISIPCQGCFKDLVKKIVGDPKKSRGCNRQCVLWSAWCQDGYKEHCHWFMSECYDCARKPMQDFLKCTGTGNQDLLMQAYDDYANYIKSQPTHTQYIIADLFVNAVPVGLWTTPFIEANTEH